MGLGEKEDNGVFEGGGVDTPMALCKILPGLWLDLCELFSWLKSLGFGDLVRPFSSSRRSDLCEIRFGVYLGCKLREDQ